MPNPRLIELTRDIGWDVDEERLEGLDKPIKCLVADTRYGFLGRCCDPLGTTCWKFVCLIRPQEIDSDRSQLVLQAGPSRHTGDVARNAGRRSVGRPRAH